MHGESPWTKPRTKTAVPMGPATSASTAAATAFSGSDRGEAEGVSSIAASVVERRQDRRARADEEHERHQQYARDEQPEGERLLVGPAQHEVYGCDDEQEVEEL